MNDDAVRIWFAVGDTASHEGHVTHRWSDEEWTYEDVCGAHGTVFYEGPSEEQARTELAAWLRLLRSQSD